MKFNELEKMMQKPEPKPDTYEAGMAQNQLLKIGTHAIKIHNMIDDGSEMEAWVAKKIDLASSYVKSVHGYTAGSKAGAYDDDGMSEARLQSNWAVSFQMPKGNHRRNSFSSQDDAEKFADTVKSKGGTVDSVRLISGKNADDLSTSVKSLEMKKMPKGTGTMQGVKEDASGWQLVSKAKDIARKMAGNLSGAVRQIEKLQKDLSKNSSVQKALLQFNEDADIDANFQSDVLNFLNNKVTQIEQQIESKPALTAEEKENKEFALKLFDFVQKKLEQKDDNKPLEVPQSIIKKEDAGEGHMSKSQLYATAKMAIELIDMIKKGDDLEGWVQTKLNLAADYLQAVYHYEDYQKLSPYREELDSALVQRHAGVIQKHLDEILSKETETADVDTKPGMMRILKKRVNEVEKEIAKENRKNTDEGDGRKAGMHPKGHPMRQKQQAAIHANEADLDEGIKDWAKNVAMAGVVVAGLAGVGSINDAINNSVPAIQAMNTALEMAQDSNNDALAKAIEKDLSDAKLRLDTGKDLNHVKYLQDKYSKFISTEGLAYESKLALQLNQQLK